MRLIFAGSSRDGKNLAPTAERLVNWYPVPAPEGSRASLILRSSLGTREWSNATGPFLRDMVAVEGVLYAISGGGLYRVAENGQATFLAAVTDDPETSMAGHRSMVTASAGGNYYLFKDGALTSPGSGRLTNVESVAFLDQFTLMTGGREVEWTAVGQPDVRNALNFATAEGRDDKIVRVMAYGGYAWVLKQTSTEVWANTGQGSFNAFRRTTGGVQDIGLLAYNLACWTPGGIFFIGSDKTARFGQQQVSTPAVDQAIEQSTPTHVFYYEDRGQRFCVVRFDDRPALVYDASLGRWHERSSGVDHGPWDIVCSAYCYSQWLLGSRLGRIYKLGETPVDVGGPMRRTAVSRPVYADSERFTISKLEILGRFGVHKLEEAAPNWLTTEYGLPLLTEDGRYILVEDQQPVQTIDAPVRLWIRVSRDGGYTWGLPKIRDVGRQGDYEARATFRAMGQFRQMTVEVNMTDPVDVPLLGEALVE